jgi:hypothetical protein
MDSHEKIVPDATANTTFRAYFDEACRINGIYIPHGMDSGKLREKWNLFSQKCPSNLNVLRMRYFSAAEPCTWQTIMKKYYRG